MVACRDYRDRLESRSTTCNNRVYRKNDSTNDLDGLTAVGLQYVYNKTRLGRSASDDCDFASEPEELVGREPAQLRDDLNSEVGVTQPISHIPAAAAST